MSPAKSHQEGIMAGENCWAYRKFETKGNTLISIDNEPLPGEKMKDIEHLNAFGKDGWDLVSVTVNPSSGNSTFFMKRQQP
jgi:hypothetical protein